ncbi:unnamed protein product [Blepharisma stoltei]|uniref:Uncharacterized protein n=1 Tax=Blepharisma stoltei TaxID=1481888 RepID=A0AAU9IVA0_9CILI|nr:unnamed protein product [Blepharisma stoltei]
MLRFLIVLPMIFLAESLEEMQKTKVSACLYLVHIRINSDAESFRAIFDGLENEDLERASNKVIGEMVLNCVENIDKDTVEEIQTNFRELAYKSDYDKLLSYDKNDLLGDIHLTPEQIEIMEEATKQSEESYYQEHPELSEEADLGRKQKLAGCLSLARYKISEDDPIIKQILQNMPSDLEEKIMNKIVGDILIGCMDKITDEIVAELMKTQSFSDLKPEHKNLLVWDSTQFKKDQEIKFTQKHFMLFDEVMESKKEAEKYYQEQQMENLENHEIPYEEGHLSNIWIIVVGAIVIIIGYAYYSATGNSQKEEPKPTDSNNKTKKRE